MIEPGLIQNAAAVGAAFAASLVECVEALTPKAKISRGEKCAQCAMPVAQGETCISARIVKLLPHPLLKDKERGQKGPLRQ
jgi:hypothetical protein